MYSRYVWDGIHNPEKEITNSISVCSSSIFEVSFPANLRHLGIKVTAFYEPKAAMNESLGDAEVALEKMLLFDGLSQDYGCHCG